MLPYIIKDPVRMSVSVLLPDWTCCTGPSICNVSAFDLILREYVRTPRVISAHNRYKADSLCCLSDDVLLFLYIF